MTPVVTSVECGVHIISTSPSELRSDPLSLKSSHALTMSASVAASVRVIVEASLAEALSPQPSPEAR